MLNLSMQQAVPQTTAMAEDNTSEPERIGNKTAAGIHIELSPLGLQKSKKAERDSSSV